MAGRSKTSTGGANLKFARRAPSVLRCFRCIALIHAWGAMAGWSRQRTDSAQTAHRQRTDNAQTTHRQRTEGELRFSHKKMKVDQSSITFFSYENRNSPSVRCLCVVCALSVRCLCAVCALSVRCLCAVCAPSVRRLCSAAQILSLPSESAPRRSAMTHPARLADQGFWARARLADLGFALHVFSLLRTVMTPPACTLARWRAWCGEVTPEIWARGLRPQPTDTHHFGKM